MRNCGICRASMSQKLFEQYKTDLMCREVTNTWNGYGSAIFLEFGKLSSEDKNGNKHNNPKGEITIMVEWDWRAEKDLTIICGSSVESPEIEAFLSSLVNEKITALKTTGQLPELEIKFSNDIILKTFMTDKGQPEWAFMDDRTDGLPALGVENGKVSAEN